MSSVYSALRYGVKDGAWSRNLWIHIPVLYQLRYQHQIYAPNLVSHYSWQKDFSIRAWSQSDARGGKSLSRTEVSGSSDQRANRVRQLSIFEVGKLDFDREISPSHLVLFVVDWHIVHSCKLYPTYTEPSLSRFEPLRKAYFSTRVESFASPCHGCAQRAVATINYAATQRVSRAFRLEQYTRVELVTDAWQAPVLPLN